MNAVNKMILIDHKQELGSTLEHLSNQLRWIEQHYIMKVNEDISKEFRNHQNDMNKVKATVNIIQQNGNA